MEKSFALRNCAFYSETKASISDSNETSQFKAAVLHPKKHNLTIETMILPQTAEENMVTKKTHVDFNINYIPNQTISPPIWIRLK